MEQRKFVPLNGFRSFGVIHEEALKDFLHRKISKIR
jgi:hypothetical protein